MVHAFLLRRRDSHPHGLHSLLTGLIACLPGALWAGDTHADAASAYPAAALLALAGWALALFCRSFLDTRPHWPKTDARLRGLQWLCLICLPTSLMLPSAGLARMAVAVVLMAAPAAMLMIAFWLLKRGIERARFVVAALGVTLLAAVAAMLPVFVAMPGDTLGTQGPRIGAVLVIALLALALAHRHKLTRDERERLHRAQVTELEARVLARTRDLEDVSRQLSEANQRLLELTEQDALTGLKNRIFLAKYLPETWRHAQRWGEPLAALMIDIDHFKRVNDEHGHLTGDEALRQVAHVIGQIVLRPGDHAVRYAGEAFLVLLPNTHLAGAAHVAENIRRKVEALQVRSSTDRPIPLTVSVGVACVHATGEGNHQALINAADQLLYQAKQHGRNRCALHPEARGITAARPAFKPAAQPVPASTGSD